VPDPRVQHQGFTVERIGYTLGRLGVLLRVLDQEFQKNFNFVVGFAGFLIECKDCDDSRID